MTDRPLAVRPAREDDAARIAAWNVALARESEDLALDPATVERGVRRGMADPARARYVVAELDGRPVGGLMLTTEWTDWRDGWHWWIQSVFVDPGARGLGVYDALHAFVLEAARRDAEVRGIRLYVEAENARARRVYERNGMCESGYRLYDQPVER